MIVARCRWCGMEMDLPPRPDGHVHMSDVKAVAEEHYSGILHAEAFLFCKSCWKAEEGHRPCYDVECFCECST